MVQYACPIVLLHISGFQTFKLTMQDALLIVASEVIPHEKKIDPENANSSGQTC